MTRGRIVETDVLKRTYRIKILRLFENAPPLFLRTTAAVGETEAGSSVTAKAHIDKRTEAASVPAA
jgi:hypothetical protein